MELCPEINYFSSIKGCEEQYFSTQLCAELNFSLTLGDRILTPTVNPQQ